MKIVDLGACQDRIWMLYDTANELDVLLGDLRRAVHDTLRTSGAEIDLRLPKDIVHAIGHLDARIGALKDLIVDMIDLEQCA